jgi:hypothetical protein
MATRKVEEYMLNGIDGYLDAEKGVGKINECRRTVVLSERVV